MKEELIDKLSGLNIESQTALEIADKYIAFKYYDSFMCFLFGVLVFIGLPITLYILATRNR